MIDGGKTSLRYEQSDFYFSGIEEDCVCSAASAYIEAVCNSLDSWCQLPCEIKRDSGTYYV